MGHHSSRCIVHHFIVNLLLESAVKLGTRHIASLCASYMWVVPINIGIIIIVLWAMMVRVTHLWILRHVGLAIGIIRRGGKITLGIVVDAHSIAGIAILVGRVKVLIVKRVHCLMIAPKSLIFFHRVRHVVEIILIFIGRSGELLLAHAMSISII